MKKLFLLLFALLTGLSSHAAWTKPAVPEGQPLTAGAEVYLYNVDFGGFLVGANDWGTRASLDPTHGHKVYVREFADADAGYPWDGESYFITNYIEKGGMAGQVGSLFIGAVDALWVDQPTSVNADNQGFTFAPQGGNVYKIGLSPKNKDFNNSIYMGSWVGAIPEKKDTRLYICGPNMSYDTEAYQVRWIFVSPADYADYTARLLQYEAAVRLGEAIQTAKAENPGIDVSVVEAVYNNENSTVEQLREALQTLADLVVAFQTERATPETPADYTKYIVNPSYTDGNNDGWSGTNATVESWGAHYDNAEIYNANYDYYQTLTGLPAGVYRVDVTGYYRSGTNNEDAAHQAELLETGKTDFRVARLYAANKAAGYTNEALLPLQNSGATAEKVEGSDAVQTALGYVPNSMRDASLYFKAGKYEATTVPGFVSDGSLTIGLRKEVHYNDEWTMWDDWHLYYLGDSDASFQWLARYTLSHTVDYVELMENDPEIYCQKSVYEAYASARQALTAATSAADIQALLGTHEATAAALASSIRAYAAYYELYSRALDWLETMANDSEEAIALADYIMGEGSTGFNGNGGAKYILSEGPLDDAQIAAERIYLDKLFTDAQASGMKDGDDCTYMLKNAGFSEEGTGWSYGPSVTFPTDNRNIMQGWNVVFDVYQELEGLQNGLYELSYNGLYRPTGADGFTTDKVAAAKCYAYINNYDTKLPGIMDDLSAEALAGDDADYLAEGYGPNSAAGAATHFLNGKYAAHAYGLVTDGKLRVGFRNDLRVDDNSVAWVGPVKLIFRAKNAEALQEILSITKPQAQELVNNSYCGLPEIMALDDALNALDGNGDLYAALIVLKQAMEDVQQGVGIYERLRIALLSLEATIDENPASPKRAEAQELYNTVYNAFSDQEYSNEEAEQAITDVNAMVVKILFPDGDEASEENPVDYTSAIVNNNFDPERGSKSEGTIEGWTTTAMNGYKQFTVSYNRAPFELYQELTGLPKGKYKVTVHTYYRAGYWDEEENRVKQGVDTHLTTLYAQTSGEKFTKPVMNLYEDATDAPVDGVNCYQLGNGKYAPDGTAPTAAYFAAGYYLNELVFTVPEDGKVIIGLSKTKTFDNDYEVVGEWKLWYMGDPNPGLGEEQDRSSLIVNNNFDPERGSKSEGTIEGWTTTAMNGYKQFTVSYNRAPFELYQDLAGLAEGTYKVTVHTYYRAGYWNEEENRVQQGVETHLTTMYAQTADRKYAKLVMNLYEDATDEPVDGVNCYLLGNGKYAPDGTAPTAAYFAAGYYLNELPFYVGNDGSVRIGLSKTETFDNDYEVVGEWNLYYYGKGDNVDLLTGIEDVNTDRPAVNVMPVGFYSLSGTRLSAPRRGVNIVRMADGTVRKVLVK
ncbi:MAG: hypothetical protein K2O17_00080 [Bacteroidaceae bacterium]|nr:hypothetical protein [Bacteroidaceae bacterium]